MGKIINAEEVKPGILYLDNREPDYFADMFAEVCPLPIDVVTLKTGDVVCEDIAIERKTIDDFVGSLMSKHEDHDGRLFSQSDRLVKEYRKHYIFVTQTIKDYKGHVHKHCILGGLARMLEKGMTVAFGIDNDEDFVYLVMKVLEKEGKLKMIVPKVKKQTSLTKEEPKIEEEIFVGAID